MNVTGFPDDYPADVALNLRRLACGSRKVKTQTDRPEAQRARDYGG